MEKKFSYNGNIISFQREGNNLMTNATEMAKPFGKQPSEWLRLPSTLKYIGALEAMGKSHRSELVVQMNGKAIWLHENIALEFARWLSLPFAIWCNDRIKEILKYGATAVNPEDLLNPDFIISLAQQLKEERAKTELLQARTDAQKEQLMIAAPKTQYFDEVLQSNTLIQTNIIAKDLGMSAITLNKILHDEKIIYKSGDTWVLYQKFQGLNYSKSKTFTFTSNSGEQKTVIHNYWTESGRKFIMDYVKSLKK